MLFAKPLMNVLFIFSMRWSTAVVPRLKVCVYVNLVLGTAYLYMAQLMSLPLAVSCFSKIQIGFTFLVPGHPGSPGQRAVKRARACVRACVRVEFKVTLHEQVRYRGTLQY